MARMHSHNKGKSSSTRLHEGEAPEWSNKDRVKVEELVVELHKKGHSTAVIGTILRDQHAVPDIRKVTGMRITGVLAKHGITHKYPEDLMNMLRNVVSLLDHLETNHKDLHNQRLLHLIESKIRRLARYYRNRGLLSADWKYKRDQVRLLVE